MKKALLSVLATLIITSFAFAADPNDDGTSALGKQIKKTAKSTAKHNNDMSTDDNPVVMPPPPPPLPPSPGVKKQKAAKDEEVDNKDEVSVQEEAVDPNVKKVKAPDQNKKLVRLWMKNVNEDQLTLVENVYSKQIEELEKIKKQAELDAAEETVKVIDEIIDAKTKEQNMLMKKIEAKVETEDKTAADKKERTVKSRKSKSSVQNSSDDSSGSPPPPPSPSSSSSSTVKKKPRPTRKKTTESEY